MKLPLPSARMGGKQGDMLGLSAFTPCTGALRSGWHRLTLVPRAVCLLAGMTMVTGVVMGAVLPTPALAQDAVQQAIDRVQGDNSYQTELEQRRPPEKQQFDEPDTSWLRDFFNWLGGAGRWLPNAIGILIVIALAIMILYMTVPAVRSAIDRMRGGWRRKPKGDTEAADESWRPDEAHARDLLSAADALAREGRFAEAVRLLLIRSVEEIGTRRPGAVRPAYTARAIAALEDLPELARNAFARVGAIVERGIWAERPLAENDWQEARAAYQDFAFGPHWRATPQKSAAQSDTPQGVATA